MVGKIPEKKEYDSIELPDNKEAHAKGATEAGGSAIPSTTGRQAFSYGSLTPGAFGERTHMGSVSKQFRDKVQPPKKKKDK